MLVGWESWILVAFIAGLAVGSALIKWLLRRGYLIWLKDGLYELKPYVPPCMEKKEGVEGDI